MKRAGPWGQSYPVSSDDSSDSDSDSDSESDDGQGNAEPNSKNAVDRAKDITPEEPNSKNAVDCAKDITSEGAVIQRAQMYQEYMKHIPIPSRRGSVIPFTTWQGLAKSVKQLYGQPLHYLTNVVLKQWDQSRIGTDDEHQPLDVIVHPCKAEATIWLMEEVHRLTSSHHQLAKLWASDPMHHAFVDPIFPQI